MRQVSGYLADEGELPAFFQRLLHFIDFGQILKNHDVADHRTLRILER